MPHLHGKGPRPHPCGKCKEDIPIWDGIFCDQCEEWYHAKCDQLVIQNQEAFRELPEAPYICRACRCDDKGNFLFTKSLERLHKGAKQGIEKLHMFVERERQFMKEDFTFTMVRSPKYSVDAQAETLLREQCPAEKKNAARVTRDGNSLFSAVSLALVGSEKLAVELRVRCSMEMVVFNAFYRWQENSMHLAKCAPDYSESCLNCATPGEDSCVWTLSALASVVGRCVQSIYPGVNGKMDMAVDILNRVFTPRCKLCDGENLKIFWGGMKKSDQGPGSWVPEVFVPLVDMPTTPLSPVVMSPYLTPSRVSGRVRKPTAKVLAITNPKIKTEVKLVVENTLEDDPTDHDFTMPSDFTLEPTEEDIFNEKYRPERLDLNWMDKYAYVAAGGKPLKGTAFLPAQEVFNELTMAKELCPSIPNGKKEDVFFVVDNNRNLRYKHRRNYFQDDCGRYNQRSGTTCKSFYMLSPNNMLQQLIKDKGKYCKESRRVAASPSNSTSTPRGTGGRGRTPSRSRRRGGRGASASERKVTKWIPMEPQPDEDQIVVLHRYYSSLDVDPTYKRRISWFSNLPARLELGRQSFLVEYITKPMAGLILPDNRKGGHPAAPAELESLGSDDAEMPDEASIVVTEASIVITEAEPVSEAEAGSQVAEAEASSQVAEVEAASSQAAEAEASSQVAEADSSRQVEEVDSSSQAQDVDASSRQVGVVESSGQVGEVDTSGEMDTAGGGEGGGETGAREPELQMDSQGTQADLEEADDDRAKNDEEPPAAMEVEEVEEVEMIEAEAEVILVEESVSETSG